MDGTHGRQVSESARAAGSAAGPALEPWPTAKQRAGVEQAVRRVLDALVPERAPPRHADPPGPVRRYRTPRGCILQDDARAVSVSWFPAAASEETLGELQVIVWAGTVSRPGATQRAAAGARPVAEARLFPVPAGEAWSWRVGDGTVLPADAVVARCLALLAERVPAARTVGADV
jgi:hypothetical protein